MSSTVQSTPFNESTWESGEPGLAVSTSPSFEAGYIFTCKPPAILPFSGSTSPYLFRQEDTAIPRYAQEDGEKSLVIAKPAPKPPHLFKSLQAWEGTVTEVGHTTFKARLFDRKRPNEEETAEFELSEIAPDDQSLVTQGAVFYWDIGYLITSAGNRRASEIRFRRLPAWTRDELEAAKREAIEFRELVGWK